MHDIYFGILHEDTINEATLYLPSKVLVHPHAFLLESLRFRKGKANGGKQHRYDPDQDTDQQEELNEAKMISKKRCKSQGNSRIFELSKWENCVISHSIWAVRRRRSMCWTAGHSWICLTTRKERIRRSFPSEEAQSPTGADPELLEPTDPIAS